MNLGIYIQIILKEASCAHLQDSLQKALLEDKVFFKETEFF